MYAVKLCILGFLLVGLIFTDADLKILPDAMTKPGIMLGFLLSWFVHVDASQTAFMLIGKLHSRNISPENYVSCISLLDSFLGALVGSGFIWGVAKFYKLLRGVEGMGFGDVKLMGLIGAFLGARFALYIIMGASVLGSFVGITLLLNVFRKRLLRRRRNESSSEKISRAWGSAQLIMRYYEMPFGVFLGGMALILAFIDAILSRGII
jgi:leader peptidase (prepilin peptidase)/N-methyltransferase